MLICIPDFRQYTVSFDLNLSGFLFRHPAFDHSKTLRCFAREADWSSGETEPDLRRSMIEIEAHSIQGW